MRAVMSIPKQKIDEMSSAITAWLHVQAHNLKHDQDGQGTTEYAILVGVLVVIAIVAIVAFKGKIQELWTAIADGINSL